MYVCLDFFYIISDFPTAFFHFFFFFKILALILHRSIRRKQVLLFFLLQKHALFIVSLITNDHRHLMSQFLTKTGQQPRVHLSALKSKKAQSTPHNKQHNTIKHNTSPFSRFPQDCQQCAQNYRLLCFPPPVP